MLPHRVPLEFHQVIDGYHYRTDTGSLRLLVPPAFTESIIRDIHSLGHFCSRRTFNSVAFCYFWPKMAGMIASYVKHCAECQQNKMSNKKSRPFLKFPVTSRFCTLHVDLVGPLTQSSTLISFHFLIVFPGGTKPFLFVPSLHLSWLRFFGNIGLVVLVFLMS